MDQKKKKWQAYVSSAKLTETNLITLSLQFSNYMSLLKWLTIEKTGEKKHWESCLLLIINFDPSFGHVKSFLEIGIT